MRELLFLSPLGERRIEEMDRGRLPRRLAAGGLASTSAPTRFGNRWPGLGMGWGGMTREGDETWLLAGSLAPHPGLAATTVRAEGPIFQ